MTYQEFFNKVWEEIPQECQDMFKVFYEQFTKYYQEGEIWLSQTMPVEPDYVFSAHAPFTLLALSHRHSFKGKARQDYLGQCKTIMDVFDALFKELFPAPAPLSSEEQRRPKKVKQHPRDYRPKSTYHLPVAVGQ